MAPMNPLGTRERLIVTAERLFAERGIAAVSLREVNLAAGQRNTSSAHYHFGSKEALVEAILDLRQVELGERRQRLYDELTARETPPTVRDWVYVLVQPFVEFSARDSETRNFVPFLAHLFVQPPQNWQVLTSRSSGFAMHVALELNRELQLPFILLRNRTLMILQHVVNALATHMRASEYPSASGLPPLLPLEAFGVSLIDGVTAYMSAPVSPELAAILPPPIDEVS